MIKKSWVRRTTLLTAVVAGLLAPAAATPATAASDAHTASAQPAHMPEPPAADVVVKELAELNVAAPHAMTGYSRAKFPHWIKQYGECDTREVVLKRDGTNVTQDDKCRAVSGSWYSEYDGKTLNAATQVDIDHMVPLANAWRSGADEWDTNKRRRFANDLQHSQLIAVSAASNRSKGDQSPDQWRPPRRAYWCTYARAWTDTKYVYGLNVTGNEKTELSSMLDTCR